MRIAFWVYGLLYVMVEVIGQELESVGWVHLTPMDVAQAVTDAALVVSVVLALLVGARLGALRWQRSLSAWYAEQALLRTPADPAAPMTVTSWRPEPLALPAAPTPAPRYPAPTGPLDGGPPYR
jgi:hypothetical protein